MVNERYYYSIMSADERQVYKIIFQGLRERAMHIFVALLFKPEEVQEIYLRVLFDNPLFYYVNQTVIKMVGGPGCYILFPEYLYSQNEIKRINADIRSVVNKVGEKAQTMRSDEFRLEKFLHDSVVKSVAYDYDSLMKNDCFNAHSIVGVFLDKKAVCEGIAKAFKLLCNEYSIKCIVVIGKADPHGKFDGDSYHAWNLVKINGESYHVDPTWDNMYHDGVEHISYDYFNVTTEEIQRDHQPIGQLPICTSSRLNYFACTHSFVKNMDELIGLITERIEKKAIMFKYIPGEDFNDMPNLYLKTYLALTQVMLNRQMQRKFRLLFNEAQNIGKILFVE